VLTSNVAKKLPEDIIISNNSTDESLFNIVKILVKESGYELGFDINDQPDNKWLLTIL